MRAGGRCRDRGVVFQHDVGQGDLPDERGALEDPDLDGRDGDGGLRLLGEGVVDRIADRAFDLDPAVGQELNRSDERSAETCDLKAGGDGRRDLCRETGSGAGGFGGLCALHLLTPRVEKLNT